jgi:valyl-tRNA synthetase
MVRPFTSFSKTLSFPGDEADFETIMSAVRAVRARRAEMNVPPSKKPSLTIVTDKVEVFEAGTVYLGRLAYAGEVVIQSEPPADLAGLVSVVTGEARLFIPLAELVDLEKERERITKDMGKTQAEIDKFEKKLSNEQFIAKAPESVVAAEREKLEKLYALMSNLEESLGATR